jgi:succinoglycan biosynthesis transport protein ExoP
MSARFDSFSNPKPSFRTPARSEGPFAFFARRWGIIAMVLVLTLAGAAAYIWKAQSKYVSTASLYVQPIGSRVAGEKNEAPAISGNFLNTQREILVSVPIISMAVNHPEISSLKSLQVADPQAWLRQELRVVVGKTDDIIRLSLDTPYPREASLIIKAVIDSYVEFQTGQKHSSTAKLVDTFSRKKGEAEARAAELENAQREFQKQAGTLPFDQSGREVISQQMARLRQEVADTQRKAADAKIAYDDAVLVWGAAPVPSVEAMRQMLGDQTHSSLVLATDIELGRMRTAISDVEQQLESLGQKYLPQHPLMKDARERLQTSKLRYLAATARHLQVAEQREAAAKKELADEVKLAEAFADHAAQYARLEADKKQFEVESSVLGGRIKDIRLEEEAGVINISVIEPPTAALMPTRANIPLIMLIAALAGLAAGSLLAFARHQTDPFFHSALEVEAAVDAPVLGCVPAGSRTAGNLNPANPIPLDRWSNNAEICRQIAASLNAVCPRGSTPAVLITSPRAGEGRSTVARDLAIALATAGERVLLVDADFQNPSLHALVGTRNAEGFSNVVNGEVAADLATIPTSIAGLDVLTTGPAPALPTALFDSPEFEAFLTLMAEHYDRVLIDAPPVGASNDARIAALACGATLLVLPKRRLQKRIIRETRDRLIGFGAHLTGVVINDLPRRRVISRRAPAGRSSVSTLQTLSRMVADGHGKPASRARQLPSSHYTSR